MKSIAAFEIHSGVSPAPCNVDSGSARGSLASDTILVPTYGQALIASTAEQSSASRAERAGLPLAVAASARGSGFNIALWLVRAEQRLAKAAFFTMETPCDSPSLQQETVVQPVAAILLGGDNLETGLSSYAFIGSTLRHAVTLESRVH